jgi:hypothetical protein
MRGGSSVGHVVATGCQIEGEGELVRAATQKMPTRKPFFSHLDVV